MNDVPYLVFSVVAGMLLGGIFFGGLWWTVRKCLTSQHPAIWMLGSGLIRMSIVLSGFYFVSAGQWTRMMACMVGLITARLIVTRLTRSPIEDSSCTNREAGHAS